MLKDYKIFVANEEESRKVQEHAFKLGYRWASGNKRVSNISSLFLFFYSDKDITYGDAASFEGSTHEYITVDKFLALPTPKKEVKLKEIYRIHSEGGNSSPPFNFNSYKEAQDYIKKVLIQDHPNRTYSIKRYYTGEEV